MKKRLKNSSEAAKYRDLLLQNQNKIDPITKSKINDPVLDHQHFGEQLCRAVLERTVNSFEGKVYNAYLRYVKHHTDLSISDVLRNLADYLEADYSSNNIHHTAIDVDVRTFKQLNAESQKEILQELKIVPESNALKRAKQARKAIREGKLDVQVIYKKKGA